MLGVSAVKQRVPSPRCNADHPDTGLCGALATRKHPNSQAHVCEACHALVLSHGLTCDLGEVRIGFGARTRFERLE